MSDRIPFLGWKGAGLGVFGAGLATVIAIMISLALGFGLLAHGRTNVKLSPRGLLRLDPAIDAKLITIGLPTGGELLARQLASLITTKFVASYGTAAIAALGIGNRLGGLVFMPLFGLLMGGGTIVGQNLGAGNIDRAEKTTKTASLFGGTVVAILMGLAIVFPRAVLSIFVNSPEVIAMGVPMIRLMGSSFIVASFAIGLDSAFSGSGHNLPWLISSISGRWGAQLPFLLLAAFVFPRLGIERGIVGVWASFLVSDLVESGVIFWNYRRGTWKKKRV